MKAVAARQERKLGWRGVVAGLVVAGAAAVSGGDAYGKDYTTAANATITTSSATGVSNATVATAGKLDLSDSATNGVTVLTGDKVAITANQTLTLSVESGKSQTVYLGQISNAVVANAGNLAISINTIGANGTFTFGNVNNFYTGSTTIWNVGDTKSTATVVVGNNQSFGAANAGKYGTVNIAASGVILERDTAAILADQQRVINNDIYLDVNNLTIANGTTNGVTGAFVFSGVISDASTPDKNTGSSLTIGATGKTGTVLLSGENTYDGGTNLVAGTLLIGNTSDFSDLDPAKWYGALGTGALTITGAGTTLGKAYGGVYSKAYDVANAILIENGNKLTINNGDGDFTLTLSGVISDGYSGKAGSLIKTGTGTIVLEGKNTYTGGTTINVNQGAILVGHQNALGTGTVTVNTVNSFGKADKGILFADTITAVTIGGLAGAGDVVLETQKVAPYAVALTIDVAATTTDSIFSGELSGTGSIIKDGKGTLTLSGDNIYTGGTEIRQGKVLVGHDNAFGVAAVPATDVKITGDATIGKTFDTVDATKNTAIKIANAVTVTAGKELTLENADKNNAFTFTGGIAGGGNLVKTEAGTVILDGDNKVVAEYAFQDVTVSAGTLTLGELSKNTITGDILVETASTFEIFNGAAFTASPTGLTLNNGTLKLSGTGAMNTPVAVTLAGNGGTVEVAENLKATHNGNIIGNKATLTKTGLGTLTLAGVNNTQNFATTVTAGTLSVTDDKNLGKGQLTLENKTTLEITGNNGTFKQDIALGSTVGNVATISIGNALAVTSSGVISGEATLIKDGKGALTLTGVNTYKGGTTLNAGSLVVGNSAALGVGDITVTGDATLGSNADAKYTIGNKISITDAATTLTLDNADKTDKFAFTISSGITGAGGLEKTGNGTVILTGANTYAGDTDIQAGTLQITGTGTLNTAGSVTVGTDATLGLVVGADPLVATLSAKTVDFSKTGTLDITSYKAGGIDDTKEYTVISTTDGVLQFNNIVTIAGQADVDYLAATAKLSDDKNDVIIQTGLRWYSTTSSRKAHGTFTIDANSFDIGTELNDNTVNLETTPVWDGKTLTKAGAGTLILSSEKSTYSGGTLLTAGTIAVGASSTFAGGKVTQGPLGTGVLAVQANGTTLASGDDAKDTAYTIHNTIFLNDKTLTIDNANAANGVFELAGVIGGTGGLVKTGDGVIVLSGVNTYEGKTAVNGGTLSISADSGLGTVAALATDQLTLNNGTLLGTGTFALDAKRGVTLGAGGGTLAAANGKTMTVDGIVAGATGLTVGNAANDGIVVLSGANTYNGTTTVAAGTLSVTDEKNVGKGQLTLNDKTTLDITGKNATFNRSIVLTDDATATINNADAVSSSGVISGVGSALTKTGLGTLTLSSVNTYTGATTITGGTLALTGGGSIASSSGVALSAGNTFDVSTITTSTVIQSLTGTGGTVALGGKALTVNDTDAKNNATFAGEITGDKGSTFTKSGAATLTLSGDSSKFAGQFAQVEGTVALTGAAKIGGAYTQAIGTELTSQSGATIGDATFAGTVTPTGTLNVASAVFDKATITFATLNTNPLNTDKIVSAGKVEFNGISEINVNTNAIGTYTLITSTTNGIDYTGGGIIIVNDPANLVGKREGHKDTATEISYKIAAEAPMALIWTGAAGSNWNDADVNWKDAADFNMAFMDGDTVTFDATGILNNNVVVAAGGVEVAAMNVKDNYNFSGGAITATGTVAVDAGKILGLVAGAAPALTANAVTFGVGSTLNITGYVPNANYDPFANPTLASTLIDSKGIIDIAGLKITVADQLAGADFISASARLSADQTDLIVETGLTWYSNADNRKAHGTFTIDPAGSTFTLGAVLQDNDKSTNKLVGWDGTTLTKEGKGTLILTGKNTYTGKTTVNGGTLSISADNNLGTVPAPAVADQLTLAGGTLVGTENFTLNVNRGVTLGVGGGTLAAANGKTMTVAGVVTGAAGIALAINDTVGNDGTVALNGANTYVGGTTINGGTVVVGNNAAFGATAGKVALVNSPVTIAKGAVGQDIKIANTIDINGKQLTVDNTDTNSLELSGVISSTIVGGLLTKTGDGKLILSGVNTYDAGTRLAGGTIVAADDKALGAGVLTIDANGTTLARDNAAVARSIGNAIVLQGNSLTVDNALVGNGDFKLSGTITGTAGSKLTKTGAGTLTITGDSSNWAGTFAQNAGGVTLATGAKLGNNVSNYTQAKFTTLTTEGAATLGNAEFKGTVNLGGDLTVTSATFSSKDNAAVNLGTWVAAGGNKIIALGNVNIEDGVTINFDAKAAGSGNYALIDAGSLTGDATNATVNAILLATQRGGVYVDTTKADLMYSLIVGKADLTWAGTAAVDGNNWNSSVLANTNWSNGVIDTYFVNNDNVVFAANGAHKDVKVDVGGVTVGTMTVSDKYSFTGGQINATGAVTVTAGGSLSLVASGNAALKADSVNFNGNALDITGYNPGKTDTYNIPLNPQVVIESNTAITGFNKLVTVNGQTKVDFLSASAYLTDTDKKVTVETRLSWNSTDPTPEYNAHGNFTIADGTTFTLGADLANNVTGVNIAAGWDGKSLTKQGDGTLILTGANTYTGTTTVATGTLSVGSDANVGNGTVTLAGGTKLAITGVDGSTFNRAIAVTGNATIDNTNAVSSTGVISGANTLTKTGAGALTLSGNSSAFAGTFAQTMGNVILAANAKIGGAYTHNVGSLTLNAGSALNTYTQAAKTTLTTNGAATLGNATFAGTVDPTGTLTVTTAKFTDAIIIIDNLNTDMIVATGDADITGGVTINLGDLSLKGKGDYTLIDAVTLTTNGVATDVKVDANLGANRGGAYVNTTADLVYRIIAAGTTTTLTWTGADGGAWDTAAKNKNWTDGNITTHFVTGDNVIFAANGGVASGVVVDKTNGVIVGDMTVSGAYNFTGGQITAEDVLVTKDGKLGLVASGTAGPAALIADSVTFNAGSTLNITGYTPGAYNPFTKPVETSTLITSDNKIDISGLKITVNDQLLPDVDFITASAYLSDTEKDVIVETGLTWYSTAANREAHGNFTIADGTTFTLGAKLENTAPNATTNWDGKSLTKLGNGTLALTVANTYSGGTTIHAGTVLVGHDNAFGAAAGTVALTGDATIGKTIASDALTVANEIYTGGNTLKLNNTDADSLTLSGKIIGAGLVNKTGDGTVILSGTNNNTGFFATRVTEGTLSVTDETNVGKGEMRLAGGTLQVTGTDFDKDITLGVGGGTINTSKANGTANDVSIANAISNVTGVNTGLTKTGAGKLTLSGANTYAGETKISAGTLALGGYGTVASSSRVNLAVANVGFDISGITMDGTTVKALEGVADTTVTLGGKALTIGDDSNFSSSYAGIIAGDGSLIKAGTGTLSLLVANTYKGGTTLRAGTVEVGNNSAFGGGGITLGGNATIGKHMSAGAISVANSIDTAGHKLTLNNANLIPGDLTFTGDIKGAGSLEKTGVGTVVLAGANNTYTGKTIVREGNLTLEGLFTVTAVTEADKANAPIVVMAGGTFTVDPLGRLEVLLPSGVVLPNVIGGESKFYFAQNAGSIVNSGVIHPAVSKLFASTYVNHEEFITVRRKSSSEVFPLISESVANSLDSYNPPINNKFLDAVLTYGPSDSENVELGYNMAGAAGSAHQVAAVTQSLTSQIGHRLSDPVSPMRYMSMSEVADDTLAREAVRGQSGMHRTALENTIWVSPIVGHQDGRNISSGGVRYDFASDHYGGVVGYEARTPNCGLWGIAGIFGGGSSVAPGTSTHTSSTYEFGGAGVYTKLNRGAYDFVGQFGWIGTNNEIKQRHTGIGQLSADVNGGAFYLSLGFERKTMYRHNRLHVVPTFSLDYTGIYQGAFTTRFDDGNSVTDAFKANAGSAANIVSLPIGLKTFGAWRVGHSGKSWVRGDLAARFVPNIGDHYLGYNNIPVSGVAANVRSAVADTLAGDLNTGLTWSRNTLEFSARYNALVSERFTNHNVAFVFSKSF